MRSNDGLWAKLGRAGLDALTRLVSCVKMAMGTRNPSTRRVLPDKNAGMEWILYPRVRYWAKSFTHRVWRVRVWNSSTHTRVPVGKKYPQNE